jgi:integrase
MKTKVSLRTKPLATDRVRLYFDFYPPIVLPGKTKSTRRIFTDFFLYTHPKSPQEKEHNKEVKIQSDILLGKYSSFSSNYELFSQADKNVLTTDEIKRLIHTHCIDDEIKRASLFSIYTGLRHSDICLLSWKDFVQTETGISIDYRQKKISNLELLPISKEAQELIGQIQADDILIFPTLITKKKHNDVIKEWMKQAEIRKHITFHCFRHTHGTLLFHKGASELTVGKLMGHRSQKTTRQYIKLMDDTKRNAVELLTFM